MDVNLTNSSDGMVLSGFFLSSLNLVMVSEGLIRPSEINVFVNEYVCKLKSGLFVSLLEKLLPFHCMVFTNGT